MIALKTTNIAGCYELQPRVLSDQRGCFVKTFHHEWFAHHGLKTNFIEQYYSVSNQRTLRGLHFQLPPHDHAKMVYCTAGHVLDVAVDLRLQSPTYGQFVCIELSAAQGNIVYLDSGLAHGFYTRSETATLIYNVTSVYAPAYDAGIRWDSIGIPWPDSTPLLSDRDKTFPALAEFQTPFISDYAFTHNEQA